MFQHVRLTLRSTAKALSIGEVLTGALWKQHTKLQATSNSKQMTCFPSNSFVSGGFSHRVVCGIPAACWAKTQVTRVAPQKNYPRNEGPAEVLSLSWLIMLLEEIRRENHLGCIKSLVNNRINYRPQLVSRISSINSIGRFLLVTWMSYGQENKWFHQAELQKKHSIEEHFSCCQKNLCFVVAS